MINYDNITPIIEGYKEYFPLHWKNEKYKWEAVKHFQDNWDIDAEDFGAMFKKATEKAGNLLSSAHSYPRGMILEFAKADNEAVRRMFIKLYDESVDLSERIETFVNTSEELRIKYNDGTWNNHYQNTNAISVYLWLRYPDKYYIYKYEIYRDVANELGSDYKPKKRFSVNNIIDGYAMYDEIFSALQADKDIREMLDNALTENCYPVFKLKTLTIDFGFYLCRFYLDEQNKETGELSLNDVKLDDDTEQKILSVLPDDDMPVINTWLLTWNPSKWNWTDYHEAIVETAFGKGYITNWNCYNHNTRIGDRVFMTKLGDGSTPKGIFASGYIISDPYQDDYYDASKNTKLNYVDIIFTKILDYKTDDILTIEQLTLSFPQQKWNPQSSGILIKSEVSKHLIELWDSNSDYIYNNDSENTNSSNQINIWKISHGTNSNGIPEHLRPILENRQVVVVNQGTRRLAVQHIPQGQAYMKEIKRGDFFFLCYAGEIVLLGQFTENTPNLNQEMVDEWDDYDWYERSYRLIAMSNIHDKYTGKKKIWTSNYNSTCVKVKDDELGLFEEWILKPYFGLTLEDLKNEQLPDETIADTYTKENFLSDVFMSEREYDKLTALLKRKKNIILQGVPGVGKTFCAKRLAWSMLGEKNNDLIKIVQFHQSYSYEDFIMGYRPNDEGGFDLTEGAFIPFCEKARNDSAHDYFFIIDEINRGNLSKIFGELLMLIESDKRGKENTINLVYGNKPFYIPDNLYLIGMMNTADRSLAMIDYALRRRFAFFEMKPAFESDGFRKYQESLSNKKFNDLINCIISLNQTITDDETLGEGFCIGHSYFCNLKEIDDKALSDIVEYEIIPMLKEYWFDEPAKVRDWSDRLRSAVK